MGKQAGPLPWSVANVKIFPGFGRKATPAAIVRQVICALEEILGKRGAPPPAPSYRPRRSRWPDDDLPSDQGR